MTTALNCLPESHFGSLTITQSLVIPKLNSVLHKPPSAMCSKWMCNLPNRPWLKKLWSHLSLLPFAKLVKSSSPVYYAHLKSIQLFPPLLLLSFSGLSSFHTDLGSNTSRLTSCFSPYPTHYSHMLSEWSCFFNVDLIMLITFHSVQFSCSVVSNSWWPHGLHYARLPCPPSPTPRVYSNSCPSS